MSDVKPVDRRRWGIIYMPKIGVLRPMKRWDEVRDYLAEKGVEYDFFCADTSASVECKALEYANGGDYSLASTKLGRLFIKIYYAISPTLVLWFGKNSFVKKVWRFFTDKLVQHLQKKGVKDTPYKDMN